MTDPVFASSRLKPITPSDWLRTTERELLDGYISAGGSAVRFVAAEDNILDNLTTHLQSAAEGRGYHYVVADAADLSEDGKKPNLHQIDKLFFRVSETIPWSEHAGNQVKTKLEERGIVLPDGILTRDVEFVAQTNHRQAQDLISEYQQMVTNLFLRDFGMAVQFRIALAALGRSQLLPEHMRPPTTEEVLLGWFRGSKPEPGSAATLKRIRIFERINRSNAKFMLQSLTHWLPKTGNKGLVLIFDFRSYEKVKPSRREVAAQREITLRRYLDAGTDVPYQVLKDLFPEDTIGSSDVTYGKGAYIQALELLRHFIDDIERMESFFLVVLGTPGFFDSRRDASGSQRRFTDYDALQTRIGLEVQDIERQNPSATLVYVGGAE